jgi:hypothetical protein
VRKTSRVAKVNPLFLSQSRSINQISLTDSTSFFFIFIESVCILILLFFHPVNKAFGSIYCIVTNTDLIKEPQTNRGKKNESTIHCGHHCSHVLLCCSFAYLLLHLQRDAEISISTNGLFPSIFACICACMKTPSCR